LGNDLECFDDLYARAKTKTQDVPTVQAVTRAQARKEGQEDHWNETLNLKDQAKTTPLSLVPQEAQSAIHEQKEKGKGTKVRP